MAKILHRLGYVRKGHLVVATRDDLVGQYVGHTAPKTKEVLKRAMGGVLFIDEAYYLYRPENERDYGQEAIEMLLQVMENQRDDLVVILAGYKDRMDTFFQSNPGLSLADRRTTSTFPTIRIDELMEIARADAGAPAATTSTTQPRQRFASTSSVRMRQPHFANARSVRNAIDRVKSAPGEPAGCGPRASFARTSSRGSTRWTFSKAVSSRSGTTVSDDE